ncbi:ferrous iron transport protein B [bacterium BMS3Abin05]|nr:ferrous iron transport protein B [bacterium BMS3Abin05]GBE27866.1 ferrous iron transport protein B [bacterium BMS3Bbin03]HDL78037.1 ferrous iron transport protein B [Bacteroidota bacterium]HDZ12730.1 ferrous iron transport protein B [Bacteroidota bacterium]
MNALSIKERIEKAENEFTIALVGNPNSGKTTLFNALTGSNQHVGNWPGVTIDILLGRAGFRNGSVMIADLPGAYSLSPYQPDERIVRDFLLQVQPDVVIMVADASRLQRELHILVELMELGFRAVLDLNMMDIALRKGLRIHAKKMSQLLGIPVVQTVGHRLGEKNKLLKAATDASKMPLPDFQLDYGEAIEDELKIIIELLKTVPISLEKYPPRWLALKFLEGDVSVIQGLSALPNYATIRTQVLESAVHLEKKFGYDAETILIEKQYGFISGLLKETVSSHPNPLKRRESTEKIDKIALHPLLGFPLFLLVLAGLFELTFKVAEPFVFLISASFTEAGRGIMAAGDILHAPPLFISFLVNGMIGGLGAIFSFLPNLIFLFSGIAFLEDSGYLARGAFIADRVMRKMNLHGKSLIPLILGFGCNIPAILATRTLPSRKDRILTMVAIPFISCAARLPIYALFAGIFFTHYQGLVVLSIYLIGILVAVGLVKLAAPVFFKNEQSALVMELPPYRMPTVYSIYRNTWRRSLIFLKKAGKIILGAVLLIWFLASFPHGAAYAGHESYIGQLGSLLAPLLQPAGFGYWQTAVAFIFGFLAKEVILGTLGTLYAATSTDLHHVLMQQFTPLSAYAFMVFSLLYMPCVGTIAAIKRETRSWKWPLIIVISGLSIAFVLSIVIFQIGKLMGLG